MENDNVKLKNRIAMLEIEERKMMKKINDTRRRADQILRTKQDNEERYLKKLRHQREQQDHEDKIREFN